MTGVRERRGPGWKRAVTFNVVGAIGAVIQLGCLVVLVEGVGVHYLTATLLATEAAVVHNFVWHQRWTWRDRPARSLESARRLMRFNLSNGAISLGGNLGMMALLVGGLHLPVALANLLAIGVCSLANLIVSDVWVFRSRLTALAILTAAGSLWPGVVWGGPPPEALRAFTAYSNRVAAEEDAAAAAPGFLWTMASAGRDARTRAGLVAIEPGGGSTPTPVPGGLVHDWIGSIFAAGVRADQVIAVLEDYDRHAAVYAPDVMSSRVLTRAGDRFTVRMRLRKKKFITVVLDTVHDATFTEISGSRWQSRSATSEVREVEHAGEPGERLVPDGEEHGFMWGLHSFWRIEQRDGGVYVECRAISLSRQIPLGLGWIIGPVVNDLPREVLARTLDATRRACLARRAAGPGGV